MTFLPIVERELRVAARRRASYWLRSSYGCLAVIIGCLVYLANIDSGSSSMGRDLFLALAWLSMPYCLLAGVKLTADCVSQEKREGTLGLLFLTDLSGYDVILGKLVATSLSGFYGLLATFPILAVPLLLGGITNGQFWRELIVLVNTFLFSLAAGMVVSVFSRESRSAIAVTFSFIFLFTAILPAAAGLVSYLVPGYRGASLAFLLPCPVFSLIQAIQANVTAARANYFWASFIAIHGLTWACLAIASWRVASSWQDKPAQGWQRRWREWRRDRTFGNATQRKRLRARLLNVNPCFWLAARVKPRPLYWRLLAFIAVLWGWGAYEFGSEWFNEGVYFATAILLNCTLKTWASSEAGRHLGQERKEGALEFVLSTPLQVDEILRGELLALRRQFLGPVLSVIAVEIIFLAAALQKESLFQNPLNPVLWIALILMQAADLTAICWAALWAALTVKTPHRIAGVTMTRLLVAPWALFLVIFIMASLWSIPASPDFTWRFYVALWLGLGLVIDLAFGLGAWWILCTKFRELALQPFQPLSSQLGRALMRFRCHVFHSFSATFGSSGPRLQSGETAQQRGVL